MRSLQEHAEHLTAARELIRPAQPCSRNRPARRMNRPHHEAHSACTACSSDRPRRGWTRSGPTDLAFALDPRRPPACPCCAPSSRPRSRPRHPELRVEALGRRMHGPFGLAAGFDKNAEGVDGLAMLGFDHVEIGTVTGQPQPGNPAKRLFRLVADRALINRMGFNNDGSAAVAARLAHAAAPGLPPRCVGVNIGKTKAVPEAEAVADYVTSTERLAPHADYLVVNVSSPNTPGLRDLQAAEQLRPLLDRRTRGGRPHGHRPPRPAAGQDRARSRRRGRRRRRRPRRRAGPGRHHRHQHHHRPRRTRPRPRRRP